MTVKGNKPIVLSESLIKNLIKAIIGMDLHNISCTACGEPIDATDKVIQERIFESISDKYRTNSHLKSQGAPKLIKS